MELKKHVETMSIMSSQSLVSQVGLTHITTYRTLSALKLHPYRMQVLQELKLSNGDEGILTEINAYIFATGYNSLFMILDVFWIPYFSPPRHGFI